MPSTATRRPGKKSSGSPEPVAERMSALAAAGDLNVRNADRHWLYEQSVQNVDFEVKFMDRVFKKIYDRKPRFLREDFCGTALLSAAWVARRKTNVALGVDLDGPTLDWGRVNNIAPLGKRATAITLIEDDVRNVVGPPADILAATNFSWWGFKTRGELAGYFRNCRAALKSQKACCCWIATAGPRRRSLSWSSGSWTASSTCGTRTTSTPSPTTCVA